jgi:methionine-rich copper-binding protein CopC
VWTILLTIPAAVLELAPGVVAAHAIIVAARPAMNSSVAPGDLEIKLDFNSNIDRRRSRLRLKRPDGTEAAIALAPNAPPGVLAGRAEAKIAGRWKLNWQVLSLDGHITRGEVIFSVRDKPSAP